MSGGGVIERLRQRPGAIVTGLLLVVASPLVSGLPRVWRAILCIPSGIMASLFLGGTWELTSEGIRLLTDPIAHVTSACSGASFFVLLVALFAGLAATGKSPVRKLILLYPCAYVITLLANVSRIVLCWHGKVLSNNLLPSKFDAAAHMAIGMMVFLPLLILSYELAQRRCRER